MTLDQKIEGVLFYRAVPMERSSLARFFNVTVEEVNAALEVLSARLLASGIRLLTTDTEVQLVTAPELSSLIEELRKDDLKREIGKAGAETLAIILYRGPLSRAEIDRIRGVNSSFILRNLLVRGLIERRETSGNQRSSVYAGTPELLAHLGITKREELPDFGEIMNALDAFEKAEKEREEEPNVFTQANPI